MSTGDSLLFVYGTLRPFVALPMSRWLRRRARHVGVAQVRGRLYDLGPYPAFRSPRRGADRVVGDVYRLRSPRFVLTRLDDYEAGGFVRVRCTVQLASCRRRSGWLYLYRAPIRGRPRIQSGDYERHLGGRYPRSST